MIVNLLHEFMIFGFFICREDPPLTIMTLSYRYLPLPCMTFFFLYGIPCTTIFARTANILSILDRGWILSVSTYAYGPWRARCDEIEGTANSGGRCLFVQHRCYIYLHIYNEHPFYPLLWRAKCKCFVAHEYWDSVFIRAEMDIRAPFFRAGSWEYSSAYHRWCKRRCQNAQRHSHILFGRHFQDQVQEEDMAACPFQPPNRPVLSLWSGYQDSELYSAQGTPPES